MRALHLSFGLLLSLAVALPGFGHDTWLAPDQFRPTNPGPLTLSLTSGMEFPRLDFAIAADRVATATWRSPKSRGALSPGTSAAHALEWKAEAGKGITVFSVVLNPRPSKLKHEQVHEYIDHLGIPIAALVLSDWERVPKVEETGYRYMKYAKTFVRVRAADKSRIWNEPSGMRLELVPQNDPTSLVSGTSLVVLLLDQGRPLPRYPVALLRESAKEPSTAITDAEGRVRLALPASGRYMLRAATLETSADAASTWDVHFTTITFEVAPAK